MHMTFKKGNLSNKPIKWLCLFYLYTSSAFYSFYRLSDMGYGIGQRIVNLIFIRDKNFKRETKLINMLIFIKTTFWRTLFGKEADKLEHANDDQTTCTQLIASIYFGKLIFTNTYFLFLFRLHHRSWNNCQQILIIQSVNTIVINQAWLSLS